MQIVETVAGKLMTLATGPGWRRLMVTTIRRAQQKDFPDHRATCDSHRWLPNLELDRR